MVTLVASSTLSVKQGIPIIMGTNIGTSLTSTIIALYNIKDMQMYRLGFSAAVLHDLFNWMTVLVLLPLEILTSFLEKSSQFLIAALFPDSTTTASDFRFLEAILDLDMARTEAKFEVFLILVILVIRVIMVIMVIFNFR